MYNKTILSILIPTKNRQKFAYNVICCILEIRDNRFQLIIQDNSDSNELEILLKKYRNDSRLKYFYNNSILSFVDNFSLGISKCEGEYVTIIGDDDGINPFIIDIANWAYNNEIEAVTPSLSLVYYWPESMVNSKEDCGRLTISEITCQVKFFNSEQEVIKLLKNGCQNYLSFNLAKAYHGIIKRSVLNEIKTKTGNFIGGLSPDIYLSVAASLLIKKVLIIDYPLTISGICNKSGSADSAVGKHTGKLESAPHFIGHNNYQWSDKIPSFYSVETIWGDSALAVLNDFKRMDLIKYFSIDAISTYCYKLYPQFKIFIIDNLAKNHKISKHSFLINLHLLNGLIKGPIKAILIKIKIKLFNKSSIHYFENVSDINEATKIIQEEIKIKNNLILKKINNIN